MFKNPMKSLYEDSSSNSSCRTSASSNSLLAGMLCNLLIHAFTFTFPAKSAGSWTTCSVVPQDHKESVIHIKPLWKYS